MSKGDIVALLQISNRFIQVIENGVTLLMRAANYNRKQWKSCNK